MIPLLTERIGRSISRKGEFVFKKTLIAICLLVCLPIVATAQSQETAPRTSWGAPDLQGVYDFGTATPFQRPLELEGRSEFTAEEAAVQVQRNAEQFAE